MTRTATILLVEDDLALLEGIADLLEIADVGYQLQILKATDGQKGLQVLVEQEPDLIISDIMMPRMDGFEFLEHVRQRAEWVHIPIVFLTAKGTKHDVLRGRMSGAELYIKKPYDSDELLQLVRSQLDRTFELRRDRQRKASSLSRDIVQLLHHEFRTPLTYVTAYYEMLSAGMWEEDVEHLREYLEGIHVGARRMSGLVRNLLQVVALWSGETAESYKAAATVVADPGYNLAMLCEQFTEDVEREGGRLSYDIDVNLPACLGVAAYINEIVRQLLLNALAFSLKAHDRRPEVMVRAWADADWITVAVVDNGIGLDSSAFHKIFELFYQHDRAELEQQGAGAGLTIAQGLAELHGGWIEVESQPGVGSTFSLVLPLISDEKDGRSQQEVARATPATILLVEDDEFLLHGLKDLLETYPVRYDLSIVTASNGLEALAILGQRTPDLIITDIMMPRMNGYQLLTEVRANPEWVEIPVVFLTAKGERHDVLLGLSSGAEEYITKPYDVDELFGVIATQLDRHFLRRGATQQSLEQLKVGVLELLLGEFQLPLGDVQEYTDRLTESLSEVHSMEQLQGYLENLETASDHVARLVADFILLVELRTGETVDWFTMQARPTSLNLALQRGGQRLQEGQDWLDVVIQYNLDSDADAVLIDNRLLETCVERLVEVIVRQCPEDKPVNIVLSSAAEGANSQLHVGSPDALLAAEKVGWLNDRLAEPRSFVPALSEFSLALLLVKGIVQYHNGQLLAKAGPGRGLTFVLSLPGYA